MTVPTSSEPFDIGFPLLILAVFAGWELFLSIRRQVAKYRAGLNTYAAIRRHH